MRLCYDPEDHGREKKGGSGRVKGEEEEGAKKEHNIRHSSLQSQSRESLSVEPRFLDP
jgi:hypothetical protein